MRKETVKGVTDKQGCTLCVKCGRRITSPVDKDFNALYDFHSCVIDDKLCYRCADIRDEKGCRCEREKSGEK